MNFSMDSTGLIFTSNYPYPNLKCTIDFKCISNSLISPTISAATFHYYNTWPWQSSNNFPVSTIALAVSDMYINPN
jgi:hypothetical protein